MTPTRVTRFIVLLTYIYMVGMNALATTLPLNGQSTNEISDRYDTLFAPIGFTFSIWGVIYLLLGVYTVFQLVADNSVVRTITPWFIASNVLNGTWIIAWHYDVIWGSLLIIIALSRHPHCDQQVDHGEEGGLGQHCRCSAPVRRVFWLGHCRHCGERLGFLREPWLARRGGPL